MLRSFRADLRRYTADQALTPRRVLKLVWRYPGLQAMLAYRLGRAQVASQDRWFLWPLLPFGWLSYFTLSRYVRVAFDIRIDLSARIGAGLYIGHFGDIVVTGCTLGEHCSIAQSVHIDRATASEGPVIGDRVWIGAHAKIRGHLTIGSGSTISACGVVQRDVPESVLCLGNPARVVVRSYDNRIILGIRK